MRRRRHRAGGRILALFILLILVAAVLLRFVFLVRNVQVLGNPGDLSRDSIVRASGVEFGKSIFHLDREGAAEGVNGTGLVKLESIAVEYPSTVCLHVRARSREAMLLHMGKIRILDDEACVVESMEEVPDTDLIYISGMRIKNCANGAPVDAEFGQAEAYCAVIRALNAQGADMYVSELNVDSIYDLRLITRTGIAVKLGDSGRMNNKIAWMKSAVADLEQRDEAGGILDVSSGTKADYRSAAAMQ